MALKRRTKKLTPQLVTKFTGKKILYCKECRQHQLEVSGDVSAVTCAYCVQKMVAPPVDPQRKPEGERFPRGWHFKARFVAPDGRVFVRGQLTDEKDIPVAEKVKTKKIPKKKVQKKKVQKKKNV